MPHALCKLPCRNNPMPNKSSHSLASLVSMSAFPVGISCFMVGQCIPRVLAPSLSILGAETQLKVPVVLHNVKQLCLECKLFSPAAFLITETRPRRYCCPMSNLTGHKLCSTVQSQMVRMQIYLVLLCYASLANWCEAHNSL